MQPLQLQVWLPPQQNTVAGSQGSSGKNENGPHREQHHWRWGLVRGSASLGVGFGVSEAQARSSGSLSVLPADPDVELSATSPAPHLPACHHNNGLNL